MRYERLSFILVLVALAACSWKAEVAPAGDSNVTSAVALSAESMCKEHGVLEAICTKCNPKLIPVFQAKGDWCPEHGFPESICPICHPERGGKRPRDQIFPENVSHSPGLPVW